MSTNVIQLVRNPNWLIGAIAYGSFGAHCQDQAVAKSQGDEAWCYKFYQFWLNLAGSMRKLPMTAKRCFKAVV